MEHLKPCQCGGQPTYWFFPEDRNHKGRHRYMCDGPCRASTGWHSQEDAAARWNRMQGLPDDEQEKAGRKRTNPLLPGKRVNYGGMYWKVMAWETSDGEREVHLVSCSNKPVTMNRLPYDVLADHLGWKD